LSTKLAEELQVEATVDDRFEIPPSIKDYLENGPFKVIAIRGLY
jgi:hypothetical protein